MAVEGRAPGIRGQGTVPAGAHRFGVHSCVVQVSMGGCAVRVENASAVWLWAAPTLAPPAAHSHQTHAVAPSPARDSRHLHTRDGGPGLVRNTGRARVTLDSQAACPRPITPSKKRDQNSAHWFCPARARSLPVQRSALLARTRRFRAFRHSLHLRMSTLATTLSPLRRCKRITAAAPGLPPLCFAQNMPVTGQATRMNAALHSRNTLIC